MKFLQIPVVLISITAFLTLGPNTSVLADWEEKVVPDNQLIQNNKLIFEISSVEIPKFQKPLEITYVSTYFSRFHQGIDLPSSAGTPIRSVAKGVVIFAGWSTLGYGNLVIVQHELGYESLYAHLSSINVSEGDTVTKETILGGVGSTGFSSGNHLHLEIHQKGAAVNPLQLIK